MKVLVSFPTGDRWVHTENVQALLRMCYEVKELGLEEITPIFPRHRPFENNLHHCVKTLLAGEWDYWLTIDADNPPKKNPLELVVLGKDIIGCPTPIWRCVNYETWPWYWNAYDMRPDGTGYQPHPPGRGLQEVDAVGTGCVLFHRRVFEHADLRHGAFQRTFHDDGTVNFGNDLAFCQRAKQAGFQVFTHWGYPCDHKVEVPMLELINAVNGAIRAESDRARVSLAHA